ncbi:MAG: AAA family ATPase [Methanobrevibacter sp.]|jgi:predicted AAA+ superfamily ATPase|nr:AAA family ATPase [Candidatus Methanovirga aequatorialis]
MFFEDDLVGYIDFKQSEMKSSFEDVKNFNHRSEYYKIKRYLDDFLNDEIIENRFIVMPGLRGVGKSTILFQLYNYLKDEKGINPKNILYLSMDQIVSFFNTKFLNVVDSYIESILKTTQGNLNEKLFIFVDESHFDKKWAVSGKIIYDTTKNIFLIITGSSAIDLEVNADVARRMIKESIYPNNFRDFLSLKYNFKTNHKFSTTLENIIYFGEKKYINDGILMEEKVHEQLKSLNNHSEIVFNEFLKAYGFPSNLNLQNDMAYKQIFSVVNRVIEKDIPAIKSFNGSTTDNIRRIVIYLALSRPGAISNRKIADNLSISPRLVNEILSVLEKTQITFNIKPYGGAGKIVKKPWNYYFLSPPIKAAINHEMGRFNLDNRKCLGNLAENLVASSLYKMLKTRFRLMGLFYPPEEKSVDFLIRTKLDDIVPIEVGFGKKTKSQLTKAIDKYNADYGILISNRYNRINKYNNIIYIPLMSFGFI